MPRIPRSDVDGGDLLALERNVQRSFVSIPEIGSAAHSILPGSFGTEYLRRTFKEPVSEAVYELFLFYRDYFDVLEKSRITRGPSSSMDWRRTW